MKICVIIKKEDSDEIMLDEAFYTFIEEDLERIGDFLYDILRLSRRGLRKKIFLKPVSSLEPGSFNVLVEHIEFSLSPEIVEKLRIGYFVAFVIERQGMHTVMESPTWVKGLREEQFFEFELIEDFDEPPNEEEEFPGLAVRLSGENKDLLEKIAIVSEDGVIIFKYYQDFPNISNSD